MRFWIKPLFWMNFAYFVVLEILFSLLYWFGLMLMRFTGFMSPANSVFRFVGSISSTDPSVWLWIILSVFLFIIVMTPYIVIHVRLTKFFKRLVLTILSPEFGVEKAKLVGQTPGKLLPTKFVKFVVGINEKAREWMEMCFEKGSKKKFAIDAYNADHMRWKIKGHLVDFWESRLTFTERTPKEDEEGKIIYEDDFTDYFDGLIIRIQDAMPSKWDSTLFQVFHASDQPKVHRDRHEHGILITLIEGIVNRGIAGHCDESNSTLDDYPESLFQLEIPGDHSIAYVGVQGTDIYLFVKTNLDGTMFDFSMNQTTQKSLDLFREDLRMVKAHIDVSENAIDAMEDFQADAYRQSA